MPLAVTVEPQTPSPTCTLTQQTQTVGMVPRLALTWTTSNATDVSLSGFGVVSLNGATTTPAPFGKCELNLLQLAMARQCIAMR